MARKSRRKSPTLSVLQAEILATHMDLANKLEILERKYHGQFKVVFYAIRKLMTPPESILQKIGFLVKESAARYVKR